MQVLIVFSAMVALSMGVAFYTTGNDHLDVDKVMKDPVTVKRYMDCYLDRAPCDPLAQSYKIVLEDSLITVCQKCNADQKHLWNRFLWNLNAFYPEEYAAFQQKYDPKNVLIPALKQVISAY